MDTVCGDLSNHYALGVSSNIYAGSAYGFDSLFDEFIDVTRDHRYPSGLDVSRFIDEETEPGLGRYAAVLRAALRHAHPRASLLNAVTAQFYQLTRSGVFDRLPTPYDDGAVVVNRVLDDLFSAISEPFFLFCNLMEAHEPHRDTWAYDSELYDVPNGWNSGDIDTWDVVDPSPAVRRDLARYRDLYAASIDYLDRRVLRLIDRLQAATDRETTVLVTADHGENLGLPADDGHLGHVTSVTEGVLHVPLLVFNPPRTHGFNPVETDMVSHLDLRQLITAFAADERPSRTSTRVAAEVMGITPGNEPLQDTDPAYWTRAIRCVYDTSRKYVWDSRGVHQAVDIDRTRPCWQERNPGETALPEWTSGVFETSLDNALARSRSNTDGERTNERVERRLRHLGYR